MTKLPLGITPRGLSREQAAEYCGCDSVAAFDDWVRRGIVPRAMRGTTRWDRKAIDRALDRHSGLLSDPERSFEEWAAAHAS
ncbi:hypothetical protein [Methylobacterium sp. 391_Methyba4]|uniref:hypothetical protein n=1 Tax=Methylobacterium sp. 391_Methyba4 TaxID=3038924 RepID=UPI00241CC5DC|nr:hypothetical protein [Methylobacterium sp. 391_Methyba4]WFS06237.1 hypothetical protein P9K36_22970 [Methylobacterium sp. 391_Methyba4]